MRTDELVAAVRTSCGIENDEHALRAARAAVVVLARRSAPVGRLLHDNVSGQVVTPLPPATEADVFSLESFYARVCVVEGPGCSPREAQRHARATVTALNRATDGRLGLLIRGLPPEFVDLLVEVPGHRAVELDPRAGRVAPRRAVPVPTQRRPQHDQL